MPWYSAVTPSSLKRDPMVPYTGIASGDWPRLWRLRCTCFLTSRSASGRPTADAYATSSANWDAVCSNTRDCTLLRTRPVALLLSPVPK